MKDTDLQRRNDVSPALMGSHGSLYLAQTIATPSSRIHGFAVPLVMP
jgi:hypothetical protein